MIARIKKFFFKNTTAKQTVAKNTVWLTISNFGGRLVKAIVIIYAARVLGAAGYGVFSYALTLAGFFTLFLDPGLTMAIMRDASKMDERRQREIFSTTSLIKLGLLVAGILFVIFVAPYFSTLPGAQALLPIVAFIITFDSLRDFLFAFIRMKEQMEWEAGIFVSMNLVIVVAGFIALRLRPTPLAFGWAYVIGLLFGLLAALWASRSYFKFMFTHFKASIVGPLMQSAWPFAVTSALGVLLTNTDILIISWMRPATDVGIYSAAIRIIQALYLVPAILQYATLPLLSRLANHDNEKFRRVLERTVGTIFLVSVPLVVGGVIVGTPLIIAIFGSSYASGGLAFKILMITMLVDFPAGLIANALFAYNHQKSLITSSAIGGIGNIVFDLILIPPFGMAGSAVATLAAQTLSNWYLWHTMKKVNYFEVIPRLGKIAVAGVAMGVFGLVLAAAHINVFLIIAASTLAYVALLYLLREPLFREIGKIAILGE